MKPDPEAWPLIVKDGSVAVKIYRQVAGGNTFYTVTYTLAGVRYRKVRSDLGEAQKEAAKIAKGIAGGEHAGLSLGPEDHVLYRQATDALRGTGAPLNVACTEYASALSVLAGRASVVEACRDYMRRHGSAEPVTVSVAVARMIAQEESEQVGRRRHAWIKLLRTHVEGKFAAAFQTYVGSVDGPAIGRWLNGLTVSERTKKNIRDCVTHFFKWCRGQWLIPRDSDPMQGVQDYRKRRLGSVSVLAGSELQKLMDAAPADMVPYLALRAFAGLRDSEAAAMDWRDIDIASAPEDGCWGWITVSDEVAKQSDREDGGRRLVPIRPVLREWLLSHSKPRGPVSPYANMQKQARKIASAAGVVWKRNCLRHSYISYAIAESSDVVKVAYESGNSPAVIRKAYLRVVRPERAAEWFGVRPTVAEPLTAGMEQPENGLCLGA